MGKIREIKVPHEACQRKGMRVERNYEYGKETMSQETGKEYEKEICFIWQVREKG